MSPATPVTTGTLDAIRLKYEPVIGLEVHCQLQTRTKIFCGCSTKFGAPPNAHTCPVCLGMPGALPVLNREAVAMAVKASISINCTINSKSIFARKNYFYPDLPKGYQISQFDLPIAEHGWIQLHGSGPGAENGKRIGITRLHMEEDAGKSIHDGFADSYQRTYVDLNRSGTPLVEIVSEPDIRTPEEAYEYLTRLKQILLYIGVSDCNMEEGSLRCDANVSIRPLGQKEFGTKVEVKNLNSFRFLQKSLEYEIERQAQVLDGGGKVAQETRLWNSSQNRTESMRSKEQAHDYRYFPEPDLPPLIVSEKWQAVIRSSIPELPDAKRARFMKNYSLSGYDADVLTDSQQLADYYELVAKASPDSKLAANWVMVELLGALNGAGLDLSASPVSAERLGGLVKLIHDGTISGKMAKDVFAKMFSTGKTAPDVVDELGLKQVTDESQIRDIVEKVIASNEKQFQEFLTKKPALEQFFVGQVMKASKGQANPSKTNELLKVQVEKVIAEKFFRKYNTINANKCAFVRYAKPPEPDLIFVDSNGRSIGVEITRTYLNTSEAKHLWDHARQVPGTPQVWESGLVIQPDETYAERLSQAIAAKTRKTYSGEVLWLVVDFDYLLGTKSDVEAIIATVAERFRTTGHQFEHIWVVWQVTNTLEAQYEIFEIV